MRTSWTEQSFDEELLKVVSGIEERMT